MTRRRLAGASAALGVIMATAGIGAPASAAGSPNRQSRTSDVAIGGADVFLHSEHSNSQLGGTCSIAFAVEKKGVDAALTAGHCAKALSGGPSYDVYRTTLTRKGVTDPGVTIGTVRAGEFNVGKLGDNALITLAAGVSAEPSVFTGGVASSTTRPVSGVTAPHVGLAKLCYSGARTGQHCGLTVTAGSQTLPFKEGKHTYTIHHEWTALGACTAKPGDSGAPIFVKHGRSVRAVGILSGGSDPSNGKCAVYFTPLSTALAALHVKLLTS